MMSADHFDGVEKFEADLWRIADDLRANSGLASNEYFMPLMGLIFLRHAANHFYAAKCSYEGLPPGRCGTRIWSRSRFVASN